MQRYIVTGIGTDVGKTVVSALLVKKLKADYWKPIQCGFPKDSDQIKSLVPEAIIHPETYVFERAASPHVNLDLDPSKVKLPKTRNTLIIELAGGLLVPLTKNMLFVDIAKKWEATWIVVSRNYLGSINHTLLTLNYLKHLNLPVKLIFNGEKNTETEEIILKHSNVETLGRIEEFILNSQNIIRFTKNLQFYP